ncbi:MAG TPA: ribonuclease P protein component [bacterium]|nr:ribonuclease P protein component [bacterium]
MLKKKYRVKKIKEFKEIIKNGNYTGANEFYIKFIPNNLNYSKVSVVVPSKIEKRAVKRNRIKRQMSEIIRLIYKNIKPGFNIVFFCKSPILKMPYELMKQKIDKILSDANLLIKND